MNAKSNVLTKSYIVIWDPPDIVTLKGSIDVSIFVYIGPFSQIWILSTYK